MTEGPHGSAAGLNGAVLPDHEIRRLVDECGLITEFQEGSLQGASYDLRLGRECFTRGQHLMLSSDAPSQRLAPGQFILLTSLERLVLPDNLIGHAGLISRWAQRGLISLFSPQIDPGFMGLIVVPLFNAGHAPVTVKLGQTMFTVEFVRMTASASVRWADAHGELTGIPAGVEVEMAGLDLSAVTNEISALQQDFTALDHSVREIEGLRVRVGALEGRLEGYQVGTSERVGQSGTKAQWIAVGLAVLALVAATLAILFEVEVLSSTQLAGASN